MIGQGKATHIKRIKDSIWCIDSKITSRNSMQRFVDNHGVAGFANTKDIKKECNAKFETIGNRVFLIATDYIDAGEEVFAYYSRAAEIALQKKRQFDALLRLAAKKRLSLKKKLKTLVRLATKAKLPLSKQRKLIAIAHLAAEKAPNYSC